MSDIQYYPEGTIRSFGKFKNGKREGYWKWYRKDGTKLKTGHFTEGKLSKEWMRYDPKGKLIKKI